jgi:ABC-2 type transport system permease protein
VLASGFDSALRSGQRPELTFYVGGETLASNRIILEVTALDLVRGAAGAEAPVEVDVLTIGDTEAIPIATRLVPLLMIYAVAIAGAFVPAASMVEEKENGAIHSLLITPTTVLEYLAGKSGLGIVLAMATGVITLLLNQAFGTNPLLLLAILLTAAVMMAEIGLILGMFAEDSNTLFALMKGGGILLFYPVVFYIWPSLPQWIAKIAPTYWFLEPLFEVGIRGGGLADVWSSMLMAVAWIVALALAVRAMSRWFEQRVAIDA